MSRSLKMHAKKHLGQHFLKDTGILDRIVRVIQPTSRDVFLEVGAGSGALSGRLAARTAALLAVEIDRDCLPSLQAVLEPYDSAEALHADILELDIGELSAPLLKGDRRLRVAGNLPYNQASAIITRMLEKPLAIASMHFLLQLEMAERIASQPGSRTYGYFSVYCQYFCEIRMGFRIPPSCFSPRPRVMSALVTLLPRQILRDAAFESDFERVTKAAFAHRRKTLINSLNLHPGIRWLAAEMLQQADIDGSQRAERLSVEDYMRLARAFASMRHRVRFEESGRPPQALQRRDRHDI